MPNVIGQLVKHLSHCKIPGAYTWASYDLRPHGYLL